MAGMHALQQSHQRDHLNTSIAATKQESHGKQQFWARRGGGGLLGDAQRARQRDETQKES